MLVAVVLLLVPVGVWPRAYEICPVALGPWLGQYGLVSFVDVGFVWFLTISFVPVATLVDFALDDAGGAASLRPSSLLGLGPLHSDWMSFSCSNSHGSDVAREVPPLGHPQR